MEWIYLSPHFDDVALSCGGLVWEQGQAGNQVGIWTICGGRTEVSQVSEFAASLHERWKTGAEAVDLRVQEDRAACARLAAGPIHFDLPDCIYRTDPETGRTLYPSEESLFSSLDPGESRRVDDLARRLARELPQPAEIVCPITLGNHVDHQLTRLAVERLGRRVWYYADYPYVLRSSGQLAQLRERGWEPVIFPVSEAGLAAWQDSIAAYASQASTFWPDQESMQAAIRKYWQEWGGVSLWRSSP